MAVLRKIEARNQHQEEAEVLGTDFVMVFNFLK
jgi:hypothetical protein